MSLMISVWMVPTFVYCVWIGERFAKRNSGHWLSFLFFPVVFFVTALWSLLLLGNFAYFLYYLFGLLSGCFGGVLITNRMTIKVDILSQRIIVPGSKMMLTCLMALFIQKLLFDWFNVSTLAYSLQLYIICFVVKGVVTGLLFGQALSFWYRILMVDQWTPEGWTQNRFAFFCGLEPVSYQRYREMLQTRHSGGGLGKREARYADDC